MKDKLQEEVSKPPGTRKAAPPWQGVPLEKWNDWRWQHCPIRRQVIPVGQERVPLTAEARGLAPGAREQEEVAALPSGGQLAVVVEGFEATHQRLARIRWAPIKAALSRSAGSE